MDNTQTQMKLTPLMEASIAVIRKVIVGYGYHEEAELYDGIIDAFKSEIPQPIKLDLAQGQAIDCSPGLNEYKALLMAIVQDTLNEDPFCEADSPEDAMRYIIKEMASQALTIERKSKDLDMVREAVVGLWEDASNATLTHPESHALCQLIADVRQYIQSLKEDVEILRKNSSDADGVNLELRQALEREKDRSDQIIKSQLEEHGYINAPGAHEVNFPITEEPEKNLAETLTTPYDMTAVGPKPTLKQVMDRKKPAGDEHLSDLAKLFNQKGVPGLGDLKTHLPRVARHLFGDGITSTVSIAKQVGVSMSDAAALVKVAHACKDASGTASSEEFMAALTEVSL